MNKYYTIYDQTRTNPLPRVGINVKNPLYSISITEKDPVFSEGAAIAVVSAAFMCLIFIVVCCCKFLRKKNLNTEAEEEEDPALYHDINKSPQQSFTSAVERAKKQ